MPALQAIFKAGRRFAYIPTKTAGTYAPLVYLPQCGKLPLRKERYKFRNSEYGIL